MGVEIAWGVSFLGVGFSPARVELSLAKSHTPVELLEG
jgi:hypothetical protein